VDDFDRETALRDTATFILPLAALALLLYVPFYAGFDSQAGGIDAVRGAGTRPLHSFLFWAPLFAAALPLPAYLLATDREALRGTRLLHIVAIPAGLLAVWALFILSAGTNLIDAVSARGFGWLTLALVSLCFMACVLALWRRLELAAGDQLGLEARGNVYAAAPILTMMTAALLLILGAELFFVRDVFNSRLNTVFKLSYQAWLLLGASGAAGLGIVVASWRPSATGRVLRPVWAASLTVVIGAALLYPLGATLSRSGGLGRDARSLDGLAYAKRDSHEDWAAADWLKRRAGPRERLVEATGGQYTSSGRMAAWSGVPALLGWRGHELQWGRDEATLAERERDIDLIYTSESLGEALPLLQKHSVTYVVVGSVERAKYPPAGLQKFTSLPEMFRLGQSAIYRVPVGVAEPAATKP
jgi:uncharacterized membrane protein